MENVSCGEVFGIVWGRRSLIVFVRIGDEIVFSLGFEMVWCFWFDGRSINLILYQNGSPNGARGMG